MKRQISKLHLLLFDALAVSLGKKNSLDFQLSPDEWDALFTEAKKQQVLALVYDGVNKSNNNLSLRQNTQWRFQIILIKQKYIKQKEVIFKLRDRLAVRNIPLMVLKGHGFSRFYPNPVFRECADIDIYTLGHYSETNDLLISGGVQRESEDGKHCGFIYDGVEVENHLKMNYNLNHTNSVLSREFATKFNLNPESDQTFPGVLFPEKNVCALHIMMHTISHLAWSGITLRHLTDWAMFLDRYSKDLDFEYLDSIWKESALASTVGILTKICNDYLGSVAFPLNYTSILSNKDYEYILYDILNPLESFSKQDSILKKFLIKSERYVRHCRKHKIVYNEPFPDSFLKDIGLSE